VNINVKVGRTALMTGITLIAATVVAACGNDSGKTSVAPTTASPVYEMLPDGFMVRGNIESLWTEIAGDEIKSTGFVADVDVKRPLYGPSATAVNDFDATARVGTKCIVTFRKGMPNSNESLTTILYIETEDKMVPWAAHDGSEANIAGANRLIAHFKQQCGA
jgi:hypothetical protein